MGRVAPSVILALGTQPTLAKGEVMVGGQVGIRSLVFPITQKVGSSCLSASLGDPHLHG